MHYEKQAVDELHKWQHAMLQKPGVFNKLSKRVQDKINGLIPAKVHRGITETIKQMVRVVLFGAGFTTSNKNVQASLQEQDWVVVEK